MSDFEPVPETPTEPVTEPTAEETADAKREDDVVGVLAACVSSIEGLVDADGHQDMRAINSLMSRLRHVFGG